MRHGKRNVVILLAVVFFLIAPAMSTACSTTGEYVFWKAVGAQAATKALGMMRNGHVRATAGDLIALSSAGYAEIDGRDTNGALDGLSQVLNVGRGDHSLVEVHRGPEAALWFAVYHKGSGACAYLEVDPAALAGVTDLRRIKQQGLFAIESLETINAQHLFDNAAEYAEKFDNKIFGGNEFRIVTMTNAIAVGAPSCAVRSFEFHDHYCPGVTSGIIMALYLKAFYPLDSGGSYFVHTIRPSCKEDAFLVMLNTTPGKKGFGISYPTTEDIAAWPEWAASARNIVYRKDPQTGLWSGVLLGYKGGDTECPSYGHSVMDKLCADLWYLQNLDHPEDFVEVLYEFDLPEGVAPTDYARPGVDPMEMIGALE